MNNSYSVWQIRSFLFALLILAGGCKSNQPSQESQATIPDKWALGSSTSLIRDLSPAVLLEVKQSGIDFLEVGWNDLNWLHIPYEDRLANVRRLYAESLEAGITIWSTHLPYGVEFDISTPDDVARKNALALVKEYIDLSIEMNLKYLVIHPSPSIDEDTRDQRIIYCRESLKELSGYVRGKGVSLAIECLPPDFLGNSSEEILAILNGLYDVGICFDTNHLVPEKPEDFVRAAGKRITTLHVSDFDGLQQKHWMPGKGVIEWSKVIDELVDAGFSGPFMYEVVRRENEQHTFKDLKGNFAGLKSAWATDK
jgi:sugar phosphate isomerase/epimerase